jgi:acyl carrier protein
MRLKLRRQPEPLTGGAVLDHLRGRLPGPLRSARSDTQLADLSIDSLDVVELLCLIDEEFDVRLEQGRFAELRTVGDLADAIAGAAGPTASSTGERGQS